MNCQICDAEEATLNLVPTGEGMPQFVGPACFARMGLALAKEILPAEEIAATLGPLFVTPARKEALKGGKKSRPGDTITAEPEAVAPEGPAGGPDEVPAAAEDA
jgi:hypothetical protein